MVRALLRTVALLFFCLTSARADELLYSYNGDVLPYEPSAGWLNGTCENSCFESIENGHFVLRWPTLRDWPTYFYRVTQPPKTPPPSLWVEWRFRSNHPLPPHSFSCDAKFAIQYKNIVDLVYIYGDAVISWSGADFVWGLPNDEFRTYRFESPDGVNYWFSVDGLVFRYSYDATGDNGYDSIQFRSGGGCLDDWIPNKENAWDFVRYGTISYGEQIVESDPPAGFIDARQHPALDRFTIRYNSPNYVYLDEISVQVTDGVAPFPTQTRRLDNGPTDVVEIVLDRPVPYSATTRLTFDDGALSQSLEFTYAPGDTDGDGRPTLSDFSALQNCFGPGPLTSVCPILDFDSDSDVDLLDLAEFQNLFDS